MALRSGKIGNMSFYIGPLNDGYLAEVKVGSEQESKEFAQFHDAVVWVEQQQKKEMKRNEVERTKEDA